MQAFWVNIVQLATEFPTLLTVLPYETTSSKKDISNLIQYRCLVPFGMPLGTPLALQLPLLNGRDHMQ